MTAVDRVAKEMKISPYEVAAAGLLASSGCTVRKYRKRNTGLAYTEDDDWGIEVPRPRGPVSFGVFAHEVGHQMLHRYNGSTPRWLEEIEADEFALKAFDLYELKGVERYERHVAHHLAYAFRKAIRRGVHPDTIRTSWPAWWERAMEAEVEAMFDPSMSWERRELDSPSAGASDE